MDAMDVKDGCAGAPAMGVAGVQEQLGYRYVTFNSFQFRPLGDDCAITTEGIVLFGFRIQNLSGCRHVGLVGNAFTGLNNTDYYLSVNGFDVTGEIITAPIFSGDCPPCEPPVITEIGADSVPYCGIGVNLWCQATGTLPDHAWYRPDGTLLSWLPQVQSPFGPAGTYTLVVSNACGADTAQVEAVVDTALCVPVAIDSAWAVPWSYGPGSYQGIQLHAASTGSCPQYTWVVPWGDTLPANVLYHVNVPNPTAGYYTLIASNACGSDTLVLYIDPPQPCATPTATAAITTQDPCRTGTAYFTASATGPGPITTWWHGADGQLMTGSPSFSVPYAPWGTYTFTASNHCGTDTVAVFHGAADTTGLATCVPPQILSLSAAPAACHGDTVSIVATTSLTGPCPSLVWSNVEVLGMSGDTLQALVGNAGPVTLTATNACGQAVEEVPMEVITSAIIHRNLCGSAGPLSIDSLVGLYMPLPTGGQWWFDEQPHNGTYDPAMDSSGMYLYTLDTGGLSCTLVEFGLHQYPGVHAGEDTSITVCSNDPPFALFGMLGGEPQTGGSWRFGLLPASSTFDPATSTPGTYQYSIQAMASGGGCTDQAEVTVAVAPATPWYADHDGDGLGDPIDALLACDPPAGYVAVPGDECPELLGTIGDDCDDGNEQTVNDVVTEECLCEGELGTGIAEAGIAGLRLWPNPNDGRHFFLQAPGATGALQVALVDATGRILAQETVLAPASGAVAVALPGGLAGGTYFVRVLAAEGAAVRALAVVR